MSRDRILHVIAPAEHGGAERVVQMLTAAQLRAGDDVLVAGVTEPLPLEHPFFDQLETSGVAHERIALPGRAYLSMRDRIAGLIDAWEPTVMHTHGYHADVIAGMAAKRRKTPHVSTAHGFVENDWKDRLYRWLQTRALRRRGHVIAVSGPLLESLSAAGLDRARLHHVPNALAATDPIESREVARAHLDLDPSDFVIGWVGRLSPEKGADLALDALGRVPDARLSLVGDGPLRESLSVAARAEGIADRVVFHGAIPGMARWLTAFDVLLLSSRTEGLPIVLLEAMRAGVPIVATSVGGIPGLLTDGVDGLIRGVRSTELADAITRLRADPDLVRRLVESARDKLDRDYGEDTWVERHRAVYAAAKGRTD